MENESRQKGPRKGTALNVRVRYLTDQELQIFLRSAVSATRKWDAF